MFVSVGCISVPSSLSDSSGDLKRVNVAAGSTPTRVYPIPVDSVSLTSPAAVQHIGRIGTVCSICGAQL
jgi:hypothetical protein